MKLSQTHSIFNLESQYNLLTELILPGLRVVTACWTMNVRRMCNYVAKCQGLPQMGKGCVHCDLGLELASLPKQAKLLGVPSYLWQTQHRAEG